MARDFFAHHPLLGLPIASLVIFIVVFAGVLIRVARAGGTTYDRFARLPLEGGDEETPS